MAISLSTPNIKKVTKYVLNKLNVDIDLKETDKFDIDYSYIENSIEKALENINAKFVESATITYNENITGTKNYQESKSLADKIVSTTESVLATGAVGTTSTVSGLLKLGEYIEDGLIWTGGKMIDGYMNVNALVVGLISPEAKEKMLESTAKFDEGVKDFIATDVVGEINRLLYEGTEFGRNINKASYLKYNSDTAKTVQNVTTKGTEIALATAATVATAGLAAPIAAGAVGGMGFVESVGKSAEEHYNSGDTTNAEIDIALDGVVGALEWYSYGKLGANALGAANAINQAGIEGIKQTFKQSAGALKSTISENGVSGLVKTSAGNIVNKDNFLKALQATVKDVDTYTDVTGIIAQDLKGYYDGDDIKISDTFGKLSAALIANIALKSIADGLLTKSEAEEFVKNNNDALEKCSESVIYAEQKEKYLDRYKNLTPEALKIYKEIEGDKIIDDDIGTKLHSIFQDENYVCGLHRTPTLTASESIINDGLILTGDMSSGVFSSDIDLEKNISFFDSGESGFGYAIFINQVKSSSTYKNIPGEPGYGMIIQIPKKEIDDLSKITINKNGQNYLKPEYVVARIEVDKDQNILKSENTIFK